MWITNTQNPQACRPKYSCTCVLSWIRPVNMHVSERKNLAPINSSDDNPTATDIYDSSTTADLWASTSASHFQARLSSLKALRVLPALRRPAESWLANNSMITRQQRSIGQVWETPRFEGSSWESGRMVGFPLLLTQGTGYYFLFPLTYSANTLLVLVYYIIWLFIRYRRL